MNKKLILITLGLMVSAWSRSASHTDAFTEELESQPRSSSDEVNKSSVKGIEEDRDQATKWIKEMLDAGDFPIGATRPEMTDFKKDGAWAGWCGKKFIPLNPISRPNTNRKLQLGIEGAMLMSYPVVNGAKLWVTFGRGLSYFYSDTSDAEIKKIHQDFQGSAIEAKSDNTTSSITYETAPMSLIASTKYFVKSIVSNGKKYYLAKFQLPVDKSPKFCVFTKRRI